ncbi:unnamed protein product [Acanthoscelides obtectus]|uniref:SUN domain-containing protein n=1 Tax=Acanthoscelides obtectus TaxID=200917 RepID=A0A9P0MDQ6_ACAOB|nr:unnamed protein product [Acanthoscelides obtectus]CAK1673249.1 SUN domain-containing ossification factor [Acanthoscelides obtectus]
MLLLIFRSLSNDTPVVLSDSLNSEPEKIAEPVPVITLSDEVPQKVVTQSKTEVKVDNGTQDAKKEVDSANAVNENITGGKAEEIPSFSEWAQKRLEEVEKNEQNTSVKGHTTNGKEKNTKQMWKNYASMDCGAKLVAANAEAQSANSILSPSTDEYKLNPCTSRIWFVVELCEAIQPKRIDLANYELFSSSPKDFTVSVSERFPTRDWMQVGKFTAKDERDVQSFDVDSHIFGKYIKVEIKSHYGSEHYCPLSLFRAYGTSVFEVLQKEDPTHENRNDDDDDDNEDDTILNEGSETNLFNSAKDAVISIVRKAAEVLGNKVNNKTATNHLNNTESNLHTCVHPRYSVVCPNESLCDRIYELLSCSSDFIGHIVAIPRVYKALWNSDVCEIFGIELEEQPKEFCHSNSVTPFFTIDYLGAMCNEALVVGGQATLNVSQQFLNITKKLTTEKIVHINVKEKNINEEVLNEKVATVKNVTESKVENVNDTVDDNSTVQIKPTKVVPEDQTLPQTADPNETKAEEPTVEVITSAPAEPSTTHVEGSAELNISGDGELHPETTEHLEDHIDHIISDLNGDTQTTTPSATTNAPQGPKESIFLRLSNRIKALERNMSISSQYLEELSRRYKKQVEDIQNLLEKTIVTLREENSKRNKQLEERLDHLTFTLESYKRQFVMTVFYICIFLAALGGGLYFFCRTPAQSVQRTIEKAPEILRRKSVDDLTGTAKDKKKRRPSDQVLKIVRYSTVSNEEKIRKPKKRRKKPILPTSDSFPSYKSDKSCDTIDDKTVDWVEVTNQIGDIPFALEESDNLTLELSDLPTELDSSKFSAESRNGNSKAELRAKSEVREVNESSCSVQYKRSNSDGLPTPVKEKKEKKGFRRLFKRVF